MRFLSFLFLIQFSINSQAGEWTLSSEDIVITFKGNIEAGDLVKFQTVFTDNIKKIIEDSGGGDAEIGLHIGEILAFKKY